MPRRRWFRYSLRTLFMVVTVTGAATGWLLREWRFVAQRQAAIAQAWEIFDPAPPFKSKLEVANRSKPRIAFWRTLMGDKAISVITTEPEQDLAQLKALFLEAQVQVGNGMSFSYRAP